MIGSALTRAPAAHRGPPSRSGSRSACCWVHLLGQRQGHHDRDRQHRRSGVNQNFIPGRAQPLRGGRDGAPCYWANDGDPRTIGHSNLDGAGANPGFIGAGNNPCGVAVDGGFHVYWANLIDGTIGRANLDGSGVDQSFVGGATSRPASRSTRPISTGPTGGAPVGRANLDGSGAIRASSPHQRPSGSRSAPATSTGRIAAARSREPISTARASTRASSAGATDPFGVAVDGATSTGRTTAPGRSAAPTSTGRGNQSFISGATDPCGVAVNVPPPAASPAPPSNVFTLGKPKLNQRMGTAQLPVTVPPLASWPCPATGSRLRRPFG